MKAGTISLRTLLLGVGLLCAVIPAAIMGAGSLVSVQRLVADNELAQSQGQAASLAAALDRFLTGNASMLGVLGETISSIDPADASAMQSVLARARALMPGTDRVSFIGPDLVVRYADPHDAAVVGLSVADRAYILQAMQARRSYIDPSIVVSRVTGKPVLVAAAPVLDAQRAVRGAVIASFDGTDIQTVADSLRSLAGTQVTVTTESGKVIAHDNPQHVQTSSDFSRLAVWQTLRNAQSGPLVKFDDETGAQRYGGFATVASTGWKVWVSQAQAEADEEVWRAYEFVLIWVIAAIGVAVIAAYLFARRIAQPIESLKDMADEIAAGRMDQRAIVEGPREMALLARAINIMAEKLQHALATERTVRENLSRTVAEYGRLTSLVAAGDLSARADVGDDADLARLGSGLNAMTASLSRLVAEIREASDSVEAAASEILAATSQQVAATAEEAAAVRQMATTVAEVRQTAEVSARKTSSVADLAQEMEGIAEGGRTSVEETVRGTEGSRSRMEALAQRILAFSDQAQEIAEINAAVGELAEQSNLLAVNASIEAAKAGEAGRGFAVVAIEVKALADRSKEATRQVRRIVSEIQKTAQAAVMAAEQGVKMAEEGAAVARQSGDAIARLTESVTGASQAAQQIMASAQQQEAGMNQIMLSTKNIEQSSVQTVAATKQVERAAADLRQLSQKLTALTRQARVE